MQPPRISIVTLSFNQGRFLGDAIESILGQNYPNLDYIVVDPGSTDESRDIIARYAGRLTALLDPDTGPADGLNHGFAAATGDIFGYINADDLLLSGALETVGRHFSARPDIDAILGNGILINADGKLRRRVKTSPFNLKTFALSAMTFCQQGHFFRRSAFVASGGFNVENRTCWDVELLADMALAGARMVNVPEQLGAFRLYGETITGSGRLAAATAVDDARIKTKALGRSLTPFDRIAAPLRKLSRRIADPADAIEGIRARIARLPMD
jgi:glycosyltransferase involved in cell wall biosynthesis